MLDAAIQTLYIGRVRGRVRDTPFTSVAFLPSEDPEPSMGWGDWVFFDDVSVSASVVPEPSTFVLLSIIGLLATLLDRRR